MLLLLPVPPQMISGSGVHTLGWQTGTLARTCAVLVAAKQSNTTDFHPIHHRTLARSRGYPGEGEELFTPAAINVAITRGAEADAPPADEEEEILEKQRSIRSQVSYGSGQPSARRVLKLAN